MKVVVNIDDALLLVAAGLSSEDEALVEKAVERCRTEVYEPCYSLMGGHALMIADTVFKHVINELKNEAKMQEM